MTQDEIIELARQAGFITDGHWAYEFTTFAKLVEDAAFKRWAAQTKLAVQDERDACLNIACDYTQRFTSHPCLAVADAIRARGDV
jgi:hypothetical protein